MIKFVNVHEKKEKKKLNISKIRGFTQKPFWSAIIKISNTTFILSFCLKTVLSNSETQDQILVSRINNYL